MSSSPGGETCLATMVRPAIGCPFPSATLPRIVEVLLNLFFVVVAVLLLSLLMPETAAFLCIIGIAVVGLIIDGINALGSSQIAQTMTDSTQTDLSLGKILYYVWPKLSGMQYFASSFIGGGGFQGLWSVYPLFNVLLYCLILCALLLWRFRKEEIV